MEQKTKKVSWCSRPVNVPGIPFEWYEREIAFQTFCADWLRKQCEVTGDDSFKWFHHSANENPDAVAGFMAKMMGQSRGFPDMILFPLWLVVELKVHGRPVSEEQREWLEFFKSEGWDCHVVRDFETFEKIVRMAIAAGKRQSKMWRKWKRWDEQEKKRNRRLYRLRSIAD